MKYTRILVALIALGILCTPPLWGQMTNFQWADIPFSFIVADHSYDVGEYDIRKATAHNALQFNGPDGGFFVLTQRTETVNVPKESMLVFNKYGDKYFLAELLVAGSSTGLRIKPCKSERELVYSTWELEKVTVLLRPIKERAK